jgi:hypothetical protein
MKNENETNDFESTQKRDVDIFNAFYEVSKADENIPTEHLNFSDITSKYSAEIDLQFNDVDASFNYYAQDDINIIENPINVDTYFSETSKEDLFVEKQQQYNYLDEKQSVNPDTSTEPFLDANTLFESVGDMDYLTESFGNESLVTFDNTITNFNENLFISNEDKYVKSNADLSTKVDEVLETTELPDDIYITEIPENASVATDLSSDLISAIEVEDNNVLDVPENIEIESDTDQQIPLSEVPILEEYITEIPEDTSITTDLPSDLISAIEVEENNVSDVPENIEIESDTDQQIPLSEVPILEEYITEIPEDTSITTDLPSDLISAIEVEDNNVLDVPENIEIESDTDQQIPLSEVPVLEEYITEIPEDTSITTDLPSDLISTTQTEVELNQSSNHLILGNFNANQIFVGEDIITLLKKNTTLVLPKFGALTLIDIDSFIIHFIPYLTYNDGLIVDYLTSKYQLDKQDVENWLGNFIDKLLNDLNSAKNCRISGIGTFSKNGDEINFVQDSSVTAIDLEEINKEIIEQSIEKEEVVLSDVDIINDIPQTDEKDFIAVEKEVETILKTKISSGKNKILKLTVYAAAISILVFTVVYFTDINLFDSPEKSKAIAELPNKNKSKIKPEKLNPKSDTKSKKVNDVKQQKQVATLPLKEKQISSESNDLKVKDKKHNQVTKTTIKSEKASPTLKEEQVNSNKNVLHPKKESSKPEINKSIKKVDRTKQNVPNVKNTKGNEATTHIQTKNNLTTTRLSSSGSKLELINNKKKQFVSSKKTPVIINTEEESKISYDEQLKVLNSMIETGYYDVIEEDGKVKLKRKR